MNIVAAIEEKIDRSGRSVPTVLKTGTAPAKLKLA